MVYVVRPAAYRKAKYEGKVDADVVRSRITALKATMVEQMESAAADLATLETKVKAVVENATVGGKPIPTYLIPPYLNVGRELWKASRKFSGETFTLKAKAICDKWVAQGLDGGVVAAIAALFGVTYTPPSS